MQHPNGMTAQKLVLGFVASKPDTRENIILRFSDRFASAGFPLPSAYGSLKDLVKRGDLQLVDGVYEATPQGKRAFREWLVGPGPAPGIRALILGKLEFVTVDDLETIVRILFKEEAAYKAACNEVMGRVQSDQRQRLRERERGRSPLEETFDQRLRTIQSKHEAKLWEGTVESLEDLREELEAFLEDIAAGTIRSA